MNKRSERLEFLIQCYLDHKITETEKNELWEYVLDPRYKDAVENLLSKGFGDVSGPVDLSEQEQDQMLRYIFSQDRQAGSSGKVISMWPRLRMVAAAASVILFLCLGTYYYFGRPKKMGQNQLAKNIIKPGGNKAILTLASGEKISLTDAANGNIASQAGVVIKKTANGQLIYDISHSNHSGSEVGYNTIEAPAGGQWQVVLPDGSHVWLNALSSLKYPTTFNGNERSVELSGEAYFEVTHNKLQPFRVKSKNQVVEVLGTHFDIMAYSDEKEIKTTLLEGAVKISDHQRSQLLKPGQQARVSQSAISLINEVDLEEVIAWKEGYFKFHESLESIMNKVARWYDVEVVYQPGVNRSRAYGAEVPRAKDITTLLNIIASTETVHFKIEGRRVIVMQ